LAVILPVLMTIVLGCVDFGRFAYNYIAVTNAARAGASYAIMNNYSPTTAPTWRAGVRQAAKDEMEQQAGYIAANLTVPDPEVIVDANALRRVRVTASYPFSTLVNWNWPGLRIPGSFNLTRRVEMRLIR
jgi:Flp pilus assembly protein TadG